MDRIYLFGNTNFDFSLDIKRKEVIIEGLDGTIILFSIRANSNNLEKLRDKITEALDLYNKRKERSK